jgi:hypothetical protein
LHNISDSLFLYIIPTAEKVCKNIPEHRAHISAIYYSHLAIGANNQSKIHFLRCAFRSHSLFSYKNNNVEICVVNHFNSRIIMAADTIAICADLGNKKSG